MNAWQIDDATWKFAQENLLLEWRPVQINGHLLAAGQDGTGRKSGNDQAAQALQEQGAHNDIRQWA